MREVTTEEAFWLICATIFLLLTLIFWLMAIWLPSWQWGLTGVITAIIMGVCAKAAD